MATQDGTGPFEALANLFSPSRAASAPLDAQTDHNNTAHNNPVNITPVNLDMSSGAGAEREDTPSLAHPSARDTMQSAGSVHIVSQYELASSRPSSREQQHRQQCCRV